MVRVPVIGGDFAWADHRVKYEAELDPRFADEVAALPGGEKLVTCIQCGTCSGACPVSHHMDYTPRRIIAMTREGFKDEVLRSFTIWLCASCYACAVVCPREIKVTDVMYALKRRAITEGYYPPKFVPPVLAREFYEGVRKDGRNSEGWLLFHTFRKSKPLELFKQAFFGLKLMRRGRMGFRHERIEARDQIKKLLPRHDDAKEAGKGAA